MSRPGDPVLLSMGAGAAPMVPFGPADPSLAQVRSGAGPAKAGSAPVAFPNRVTAHVTTCYRWAPGWECRPPLE